MAYTYKYNTLSMLSLFALLIALPAATQPDFLSPLLSPVIGSFCKNVGCGKGKCKMSENSEFAYECECEAGWKQTLSSNSTPTHLKFLPCVIPNCTLNYLCSDAAPSPQAHQTPSNTSVIEPCQWANCGGGLCNKTSAFTYECQCKEGYSNLFNNTGFPCFKECSVGGDCPNLGIPLSNRSTAPAPPSLADSGTNQASSLKQEVTSHCMILLAVSVTAIAL